MPHVVKYGPQLWDAAKEWWDGSKTDKTKFKDKLEEEAKDLDLDLPLDKPVSDTAAIPT